MSSEKWTTKNLVNIGRTRRACLATKHNGKCANKALTHTHAFHSKCEICLCITENPKFARANNASISSHRQHKTNTLYVSAHRPKLRPQNASRQISSINRVVIHVHARAQKPLFDTLFSTTIVVCAVCASLDWCVCMRWLHTSHTHIPCFDFSAALNYSYSPRASHVGMFDVRIKLHKLWMRRHTHTHTSCILYYMTDTCVPPAPANKKSSAQTTVDG